VSVHITASTPDKATITSMVSDQTSLTLTILSIYLQLEVSPLSNSFQQQFQTTTSRKPNDLAGGSMTIKASRIFSVVS